MRNRIIRRDNAAAIIPIIAMIAAVIAVMFVCTTLGKTAQKSGVIDLPSTNTNLSQTLAEEKSVNYIHETAYTGALSEFPELYEIPFQKSENYVMNKEFISMYPNVVEECLTDATQFMEALYNINYREIAKDKTEYVAKIMMNADYLAYRTEGYGTEQEVTEYLYDYIQKTVDSYVANQVEMSAEFLTDESLVYSDYYIFVRGALVFTIYNNVADDCKYKNSEEYIIPMEVAMQRNPENADNRIVCAFGTAQDKTFFLNP